MIDPAAITTSHVVWPSACRIIRSRFPPVDLFEDIADPEDWPLLIAAEEKTNPRLMKTLGAIDLVPPERRVSGPGATYLMAPFTHVSRDRPSRFSDGSYGVLYVAERFETALLETMHHHARSMAKTREAPGWTSPFRDLIVDIDADLHDLRSGNHALARALDRDRYSASQVLGASLRGSGSNGVVYPSARSPDGECAGLCYPDCASHPVESRPLNNHWDGTRVDLYRNAIDGEVFRVI